MQKYYVYILTTTNNSVFYVGLTSNLIKRMHQHKHGLLEGFTKKYQVTKLVYYEEHTDVFEAIYREKRIKRWNRQWKKTVINERNPAWEDIYCNWFESSKQIP